MKNIYLCLSAIMLGFIIIGVIATLMACRLSIFAGIATAIAWLIMIVIMIYMAVTDNDK